MSDAEFLREFDSQTISTLNDAYINKKNVNKHKGINLNHEPFTHCVISDLISDEKFYTDLYKEVKSKLKYAQKNNDLYKFHQTADLGKNKSPKISAFRDKILYGSFLEFLKKITNIELSSTKIDVTSSKYEYTDYLLCHDDDIHDKNQHGRRIAFIYYLVPPEWNTDGSDGGNLDLFRVNENLQPVEIVKSLTPKSNSIAFFEVSDRSFHQVSEVFASDKTRLSINGWFHAKINHRPAPFIEMIPEPSPYLDIDANLFFDWITEKYLQPINQTQIQLKFADSSEIKLDKIFHNHKFDEVSDGLANKEIVWKTKGPANKRNYDVADLDSCPQIIKDLIKVLTCDYMGLTLSNMTGLALHSSVPKSKEEDEDEDSYDEYLDEDEYDIDDVKNENEEQSESDDEEENDNKKNSKESTNSYKRKIKDESSDSDDDDDDDEEESSDNNEASSSSSPSKPGTSAALEESQNLYKKFKSIHHGGKNSVNENGQAGCSSSNDKPCTSSSTTSSNNADEVQTTSKENEERGTPKCYFEIRRWKQGFYTLITDDDSEIKTKALDLMLFFNCKSWNLECGGNVSYIARDEDNELLTVNPEENCISLVYRDEDTLKFTKCINSRINKINNEGCLYEISVIYYE